jgi:hypothetical protein
MKKISIESRGLANKPNVQPTKLKTATIPINMRAQKWLRALNQAGPGAARFASQNPMSSEMPKVQNRPLKNPAKMHKSKPVAGEILQPT